MEKQKIQNVLTLESINDVMDQDEELGSCESGTDPIIEECSKHMENVDTKMNALKSLMHNTDLYFYNYFDDVKRQIDIRREMLRNELDDCSDRALAHVEKVKSGCMKIRLNVEEKKKKIEAMDRCIQELRDKPYTLHANRSVLTNVKNEIVFNENKLDKMLTVYHDELLGNCQYFFEYGDSISDDFFGALKREICSLECLRTLKVGYNFSVAFSRDNLIAAGSSDNTVKIWNPETGELIRTLRGHSHTVYSVAFSNNNLLASGSDDKTIKIWNPETGELIRTLRGHSRSVYSVAFSNNNLLASGSYDKTIKIWNPETGELIRTLEGHDDYVRSVAFSKDNLLASGSDDKTIKIWNPETGALIRTLRGHSDFVQSVAFSKDNLLASGSNDNTVKIWNPETGELIRTLRGHFDDVRSVAFSNNNLLASGSYDKTIKIWNPETGELIRTLEGHSHCATTVAFNNNNVLASGSFDGTIKIWELLDTSEIWKVANA